MEFKKLRLENFLTYKSLEYDFVNRPLLVQGQNLTDEGQLSNGSGKSGLQTGIEFCLTAANSRGVRDSELVSYGEKEARAELTISCDIRKEIICIDWTIKVKGSNKLSIIKQKYNQDWEEVSFSNVNDGKKWILNWIDISKDDLFNYFLINRSRFKSFFESSNKEKVDLINRFSDASIVEGLENIDTDKLESDFRELEKEEIQIQTRIDVKKESLQEERDRDLEEEFEEIVEDLNYDIDKLKAKIESTKESIDSNDYEIRDLVLANEDILLDIKDDYLTLSHIMKDLEDHSKKTKSIEKDLKAVQSLVDNFKGIDKSEEKEQLRNAIKEDESKVKELDGKIDSLEEHKEKVLELIQDIKIKLSGSITCPSCAHSFILDGDIDELTKKQKLAKDVLSRVDKEIESLSENQKSLNDSIVDFYELIKELKVEEEKSLEGKSVFLKDLNEIRVKLSNHESKTRSLKREYDQEADSIKDLENQIKTNKSKIELEKDKKKSNQLHIKRYEDGIKSIEAKIKDLKPISNEDNINALKDEISSLMALLDSKSREKNKVGDEIYKMNQWKVNFKQFRMHLANQSLEVIEYHSNRYLNEMGSDLRVKLEGYKTLANGSIKDEITAKIIRDVERSFSSFSGGEKGRLLFSSILANRYMINKTHKYGGLDFLSIDEVFEGVDSVGLKSLINSAKQLQIAVMIITHVSDENVSSDTLTIVKENGISIIKKE